MPDLEAGFEIARGAYGGAILASLSGSLRDFAADRTRSANHLHALGITDQLTLRKGLKYLQVLAARKD